MTLEEMQSLLAHSDRALLTTQFIADRLKMLSPISNNSFKYFIKAVSEIEYQAAIRILKDAECIVENNNMLTWILE